MVRTRTSSFGMAGRRSHDSSRYYGRKAAGTVVPAPGKVNTPPVDALFCRSSEHMVELPDNSIHLMVTSPPYNDGKDYDEDLSLDEYLAFLEAVWRECYRVLVPGGRACVNIANMGRKPYVPLSSYVMMSMLRCGYNMRGEIIWDKAASAGSSTAWGSWKSPRNPTLRDVHEYILVFSKGDYRLLSGPPSITAGEFTEYTKSIWHFKTESARRVGHPAPFPVELPLRCIKLYTGVGDTVLDPFIGAGSTALAARQAGRHYIGYDTDASYLERAEERLTLLGGAG